MTRRRSRCHDTDDLLAWQPPKPVRAFAPDRIRAASLAAQIARGVSEALKGSGRSRDQVAAEMSAYLGESVSTNILDKYASEAAEEHVINLVRFAALIHATRSRELLQMIAEPFGWAVVEQKHVDAIGLASALEERDRLNREIDARRRSLQQSGGLK
ncbi:MAG: DNA transposition protein [Salinarimonadaceae bacterium]|nr:MAG: DNA transposition protein [Salinarimonadaceae bacterium]